MAQTIEQRVWDKLQRGEKLRGQEKEVARKFLKLLKLQRQKIMRENPLCRFCPNGRQEEVIRAVGRGDKFIVALFAGNGLGKTALMVNILGNIIWGAQPFAAHYGEAYNLTNPNTMVNWLREWGEPPSSWFDYPVFKKKWPYPKVIRIISDQRHLDDEGAIQIEIDRWWPKNRFKGEKGKYSYRSKIETDTGFSVELMTYQQDVAQHESKTCGIIWADEPIPQHLWGATISRFRQGGLFLISMTPLFGSAYLYDKIVGEAETNDAIFYTFGDIEDNCVEHGVRGVLKHDYIERMVAQYPPEEREARTKGIFLSLAGKVHKEFNRDVHVLVKGKEYEKIPSREFILANKHLFQFYQVVDPHDRKWDAIGYYAMDSNHRKYVIDEYPDRSLPPYHRLRERKYDWATLIKQILIPKERAMGLDPERDIVRLMDPRFAGTKSSRGTIYGGQTVVQEWEEHYGCAFETSFSDDLTASRNKLDAHLVRANDGYPMILFFDGYADNHIYALEHWLWDRWEGKAAGKRDIKEKPQEKNSDFPRLLHYLVMYDPIFEKKTPDIIGWRARLKKKRKAVSWFYY